MQDGDFIVVQVCIRWVYEQGVSVLVKSFNKDRMKENLDIFDWKLSPEGLEKISQIPQRKGFPGLEFISEEGPYKSLSELWDGEIQNFIRMHVPDVANSQDWLWIYHYMLSLVHISVDAVVVVIVQ